MHLSGPVHRLIGEHAARLVHGNLSVKIGAREHANDTSSTTTQNLTWRIRLHLNLDYLMGIDRPIQDPFGALAE